MDSARATGDEQRLDPFLTLAGGLVLDPEHQLVVALRDAVERQRQQAQEPAVCARGNEARLAPAHHLAVATAQLVRCFHLWSRAAARSRAEHLELAVEA